MINRRTLLLPILFAILATSSSGCYCCHRPFLFRWRCAPACSPCGGGSCYPAFAPPPGAVSYSGPVSAPAPGCSSCAASASGPIAGIPVSYAPPTYAPASFAPPSYPLGPPSVFTGPPTGIAPGSKELPAPMPGK